MAELTNIDLKRALENNARCTPRDVLQPTSAKGQGNDEL